MGIEENGQLYFTFEIAFDMHAFFMEEASKITKLIKSLQSERASLGDDIQYEVFQQYHAQINKLFEQHDFFIKESNKYLKLSVELFKKEVF